MLSSSPRMGDSHRKTPVADLAEGDLVQVPIWAEDVAVPEVHQSSGLGSSHDGESSRSRRRRSHGDTGDVDRIRVVAAAANHHAIRTPPSAMPTPVMRCKIDMTAVNGNL